MDKSDAASESAFRTIRRTLAFYARGKDEERAQVLLDDTQAENQRLREALERISVTSRERFPITGGWVNEIVREALAGDTE